MTRPAAPLAALAFAALLWAAPAWAQGLDLSQGGAIDVTARDGLELRQNDRMVVATGDARAVRAGVTVTADRLIARYRPKASAVTPASAPGTPGGGDTGSNEVYRLEAEGNVRIFTPTDLAVGDKAVYDIDQAVLVLTGKNLSITTPNQVMTARDTMEYWSQKRMSVGRGLATVTTADGRRITADVLVGYTAAPSSAPKPVATPAKPGNDGLGASGKLERVEGFGNVEIRTPTEIVKGDRGIYVADSGIARLAGHVRLTRGQNQLEGDEALVNMRTGVSSLVREPGGRVQGLVLPNDAGATPGGADAKPGKGAAPSTPTPKR